MNLFLRDHHQHQVLQAIVKMQPGKEILIAMMRTTMQDVIMMVEIVVEKMLRLITVQIVNAKIPIWLHVKSKFLKNPPDFHYTSLSHTPHK